MKKLLALALVAMMAGAAVAQPGMGVFFSATEFTDANTNANPSAPIDAYIVLLDSPVASIGGYECSFEFVPSNVFVLGVTGPNGWTNYGNPANQICGYTAPLATTDGAVVLATMNLLNQNGVDVPVEIRMGAYDPSTFDPPSPGIVDGAIVDDLYACTLDSGDLAPVVATFFGGGIVATEAHSLTSVKALFD